MDQNATIIVNSIHNLIEYSTTPQLTKQKGFMELHNAIIKKFFAASSVHIDYSNKTICLGVDVLSKGCDVEISYSSLEEFLKSCIRQDSENLKFYKNLLHYYNMTAAVA